MSKSSFNQSVGIPNPINPEIPNRTIHASQISPQLFGDGQAQRCQSGLF